MKTMMIFTKICKNGRRGSLKNTTENSHSWKFSRIPSVEIGRRKKWPKKPKHIEIPFRIHRESTSQIALSL